MYILEPVAHETIWGGKKLKKLSSESPEKTGHLYMVNGHADMSNKIMNGIYKGRTLYEFFQTDKMKLGMEEYKEFPLTIALVDAAENLSIQVHPDNLAAEEMEGEGTGKEESWLFLNAPQSGWIYNGCSCSSDYELDNAIKEEKLEGITGILPVKEDDYVFIQSGTLHAMTAGSLVYEIEYGSDYTYRFYDYNRMENGKGRELHIDKARRAIKLNMKSDTKRYSGDSWLKEDKYETRRIENLTQYVNSGEEIECLSIISGQGICDGIPLQSGMSLLLLPEEKVENIRLDLAVAARIRR